METRPISSIKIGKRFRRNLGNLESLAKSIADIGLLHPIVITSDSELIAGRRRIEACKQLKWDKVPVTVVNLDDKVRGEYDENVQRTNYTAIEAVAIWDAMKKPKGGRGKTRSDSEQVLIRAAKVTGKSTDTLSKAKQVIEAAEEDPEKFTLIAEEMDDTGNVNAAYKEMKLIKAKEEVKRQQSVEPDPNAPIVDLAKCREWIEKQPRCDLLLTDPPYITDTKEPIEKFVLWILPALEKVKPTGRAYVFIGSYPREILAYLKTFYEYRSLFDINVDLISLLAWTYRNTLGPKPKDNYIQNYQTILYFKGKEAPPLNCPLTNEQWSVQDINAPDGRSGKRYHTWQKPDELAERLIRHSTREGDLVLDPFVGTGTFVLMAAKFGRVARGCDIDHEMLLIAKERGCQYEG